MTNNSKYIVNLDSQQGVGLLEVLIALLLLGVAALGYSALQAQSLKSTGDSLTRTQSITLLRSVAEKIRVNAYDATLKLKLSPTPASTSYSTTEVLNEYERLINLPNVPVKINCPSTGCNPFQLANNDVRDVKLAAKAYDISIGMVTCPGTKSTNAVEPSDTEANPTIPVATKLEESKCLIAAWKETMPKLKADNATNYCMDDEGIYRLGSDCIYMESY